MKGTFAVIGYGAITDEIVRTLEEQSALSVLAGVLVRPSRLDAARSRAAGRFPVVATLDELLALRPDVVAECAGHEAMRQFGAATLRAGVDLLCSSVGVLADADFSRELNRAAETGSCVLIPSGAIAGIDGLLAARTAGLRSVTYTTIKAPPAWIGTPAEDEVRSAGRKRITFFQGTAREAALRYPKNVNVGATVALASLGLDRTQVKMVSDPEASGPLGIIEAAGDFGTFRFEILAYASPHNPKTSLLTAHSIVAAARDHVCFQFGR